jgi:hypothetical protein
MLFLLISWAVEMAKIWYQSIWFNFVCKFASYVLLFQDALTFQILSHFVIVDGLLHYKTTYPILGLGPFVNLLWKFFHPNCGSVCFELELRALAPWGCLSFYSNYMPRTSWWAFTPKDARQPCWKGDKCIWLWIGGAHFSYETPSLKGPSTLYFLYAWFSKKKKP